MLMSDHHVRLMNGAEFATCARIHYLMWITGADHAQLTDSLSHVYVNWDTLRAFLARINVHAGDRLYGEITEYIKWRVSQPSSVACRGLPQCQDNEQPEALGVLCDWKTEFIRVCTSIAHVWLDGDCSVLIARPPWAQEDIAPIVAYAADTRATLPVLWFDYDPWQGYFDIPFHSWPASYESRIKITMISVREVGSQTITRVVSDVNSPHSVVTDHLPSAPALTMSVTWIDASEVGDARSLEIPRIKVMSGIAGCDFALLLTLSNADRRMCRTLHSVHFCQGVFTDLRPKPMGALTSIAHRSPCIEWVYES